MKMSEVEKKRFTFIWKVENVSMLPLEKGESLKSPKFVIDEWKDTEWYLELTVRGYILLYFNNFSKNVDLKLFFICEIIDSSSKILFGNSDTIKIEGSGYYQCLYRGDLNALSHLDRPHDILSIRFYLYPPEVLSPKPIINNQPDSKPHVSRKACTFWSGIQIQKRSIVCSVKDIDKHTDNINIHLSEFYKDPPNLKVSLILCEIQNNLCVPIVIQQTGLISLFKKHERLFVKCKISVVTNIVSLQDSAESTHLFDFDHNDLWKFPLFLKTNYLIRERYLDEDKALNLRFDFSFSYKTREYHSDSDDHNTGSFESINKPQVSELCTSLQGMLATGDFTDVTLKSGGETFPAYRVVLAAHSSVFRAMLEHDMKEKKSGEVEIKDVEPAVLKRMLTFLHTEVYEKDLSVDDAVDLYEAADKYNIVPLKQRCAASLVSSLCIDSVCDVLELADAHNDDFLWAAASNYVRSHATETLKSDDWIDLMKRSPDITSKVMYLMLIDNSPCT